RHLDGDRNGSEKRREEHEHRARDRDVEQALERRTSQLPQHRACRTAGLVGGEPALHPRRLEEDARRITPGLRVLARQRCRSRYCHFLAPSLATPVLDARALGAPGPRANSALSCASHAWLVATVLRR